MKTRSIVFMALIMLCLCRSSPWASCHPTEMGIYYGGECQVDPVPYATIRLSFMAYVGDRPGIDMIQFTVQDWILDSAEGVILTGEEWFADKVQGSLAEGMTLTWEEPVRPEGARTELEFGWIELVWIEHFDVEHQMTIIDRIISGPDYNLEFPGPQFFTFNCSSYLCPCTWGTCEWPSYWHTIRYVDPPDQASVPEAFMLGFEVEYWNCYWNSAWGYDGSVAIDGEVVETISGFGHDIHELELNVSSQPAGVPFAVTITAGDRTETLTYYRGATANEDISFSAVKSFY